jgi:CRISPR-associated protein Cmr1
MSELKANLQLITPCFCSGADQRQAEIRVPSIRGQLRWWFRVLGGDAAMEKSLFGGISHIGTEDEPTASKVCLRISQVENVFGEERELPNRANSPLDYLFYYARVSGNRDDIHRFSKGGWLAPGSSFTLQATFRRQVSDAERQKFSDAFQAFLTLGSLGLRQTRGMGAFVTKEQQSFADFQKFCRKLGLNIKTWQVCNPNGQAKFCQNWKEAMIALEAALGWIRQHGFSAGERGNNPTPLGKSSGGRQASALHLRPVLLKEGFLPALFYTPQILEQGNRNSELVNLLNGMQFKTPYQQKKSQDGSDFRTELLLRKLE